MGASTTRVGCSCSASIRTCKSYAGNNRLGSTGTHGGGWVAVELFAMHFVRGSGAVIVVVDVLSALLKNIVPIILARLPTALLSCSPPEPTCEFVSFSTDDNDCNGLPHEQSTVGKCHTCITPPSPCACMCIEHRTK